MHKNAYLFRCNFATFSRGHASGPPTIVVPSSLPLKLIWYITHCDETLHTPWEIFRVRNYFDLISFNLFVFDQTQRP